MPSAILLWWICGIYEYELFPFSFFRILFVTYAQANVTCGGAGFIFSYFSPLEVFMENWNGP